MPPPGRDPADSRQSRSSHRSTLSLSKTEVTIHVYDLLPAGRLSSVLWAVGTSLLHSGVVINGREYAYGGHGRPNLTGVYWTKPRAEPPGGTFKMELLHGFTFASQSEIDKILDDISEEFQGTLYNLLKKNCNHFTSELCRRLTGNPGPSWLNRAASVGVMLPCVVPGDWISPPEYETADGQLLLDEDEDEFDTHEGTRMLKQAPPRFHTDPLSPGREDDGEWDSEEERRHGGSGKGKQAVRDEEGRQLPAAERAPRP